MPLEPPTTPSGDGKRSHHSEIHRKGLFPHAEAVETRSVVVGQGAAGMESESLIEPLRGGIRGADFQAESLRAAPPELPEDVLRELRA